MRHDKSIFLADKLADLSEAVHEWSWPRTRGAILEILMEEYGPDALTELDPVELIQFGYAQGVGQLVMQIAANEVSFSLTGRQRKRKKKTK